MLSVMACGPSAEEEKKQKKADDSLAQIDRNNALNNANKILADTSKPKTDSLAKKDKKKK